MARIAGVDLPREKRVEIALSYIYGVGRSRAAAVLAQTGINPDTRVRDLTEDEVPSAEFIDKNYKVEGDLRREVAMNIKRLVEIGCYSGHQAPARLYRCADRNEKQRADPQGPPETVGVRRKK